GVFDVPLWLGVLAAGCLGFLVWNWPPAEVFMGDVGSGFLGFALGILAAFTVLQELMPVWSWLILLSVFLVDATFTLLRRMTAGARWYEAHRTHAYQYAALRWRSHQRVTLAVIAINLFWLMPLAWISAKYSQLGPVLAAVAVAPLVLAASKLGAGSPEQDG
ncbi:MAG: MraY family glycosyltransferase, partial [Gammaproteobacteria bacterium]